MLEFVLSFWQWEPPIGHSEILSSPPGFQFLLLSFILSSWDVIKVLGLSEWTNFILMTRKHFVFEMVSQLLNFVVTSTD